MNTEYQLKHAREILEPCGVLGEYLLLDDRGVWPAVERDMTMQHDTELLRWRPARELQDLPDAPETSETPMLPVPFTARQLAAFMLESVGALVADFYGDWRDGPDPESLEHIDTDSKARRAVIEAFNAYRMALGVVGDVDANAQMRLDAACEAYRAGQLRAGERRKAHADFDAVHQAWLSKMVRCLLLPESAPASEAVQVAESGKRWTPENLAKLMAYREAHTMRETAAAFGISAQRIRQLLPSEKPTTTPFARLVHRMK